MKKGGYEMKTKKTSLRLGWLVATLATLFLVLGMGQSAISLDAEDYQSGDIFMGQDASVTRWALCYYDINYSVVELQLNREGNKIRGQAIYPSPSFPAPITGYIYDDSAFFAINYLDDSGFRFYFVNKKTGTGLTWGVINTGEYYDSPHSAQIYGCTALPSGPEGISGTFDGTFVVDELSARAKCVFASDFPAELLEGVVESGVIRGQCTYYPAPLTGYVYKGKAIFAIGYPPAYNDNMRMYEASISTLAGTGWAILGSTSEYYSLPHSITLSPCTSFSVESAVNGIGGDGSK